ncbi:MAG: hypothetical protein M0Q94_02420 [Candidatus Cloacimonetes bacterium]|nr:hypothetical protein [Candidatus Cloacimonadota bacterium]
MEVKLVTYTESKEARQRATKLIQEVREHSLIKGRYKFNHRLIGSGKRRCIVKDLDGKYDLDYQIILTKNSKQGDSKPTQIKADFFQAFSDCKNQNEKVENSTTVITVRMSKNQRTFDASKEKFSFDFVIISIDESKRIRRNAPNAYTWVQLPSKNSYIYEKFNGLSADDQRHLLEEYIIPRVIKEKDKHEADRFSSVHIFYEEVNNHVE